MQKQSPENIDDISKATSGSDAASENKLAEDGVNP